MFYPGKPPYKCYTIGVLPLYRIGKYDENKKGGKKYLEYRYGRGYGFGKRVALARSRAIGVIKEPVIKQEW